MPNAANLAVTLLLKADISGFEGKMKQLESSMSKTLSNINSRGHELMKVGADMKEAGINNVLGATAQLAPLVYATKQAIDLEDKIADVAKVTDTDFGTKAFDNLSNTAMEVGEHLGRSAAEAAELMGNLASGGVAEKDLKSIAMQAGEIGVAFDISAGEAGDAYMVIKNALNLSKKETTATLDAMNAATNKYGGKARELLNFMAQGGAGVAQVLKVTGPEMQAFGNAFQVIGKSSEEAATTMQRFQKAILANSELSAIFKRAGGGAAGLVSILERAKKSGDIYTYLSQRGVGDYSSNLAQVATNMDSDKGLKSQLSFLQNSANVDGSAHAEFLNRQKTRGEQLKKVLIQAQNIVIKMGNTLLPVLSQILDAVKPLVKTFGDWVGRNENLVKTIAKILAISASLKLVVGALQLVFGGVFGIVGRLIVNFTRVIQVVKLLGAVFMANPWMIVIAAIAAGVYLIYKNWDKIKAWFAKLWDNVTRIFKIVVKVISAYLINFTPAGLIYKNWDKIKAWFSKLWDGVKNIFSTTWDWLKNLFLNYTPTGMIFKHWDKIVDYFKDVWEKVKNIFKNAMEWIKNSWIGKFIDKIVSGVKGAVNDIKNTAKYAADHSFDATVNHVGNGSLGKPQLQPVPVRGGNTFSSPFNMTVNLSGGATKGDADRFGKEAEKQFKKHFEKMQYNQERKSF